MKTYLSLTIGPIYKTLSTAKKTRDLWGGSYLFSYIMKQIILKFKDRKFVVPYTGEKVFQKSEVGLFHDRFIFEAKNGDKKVLEKVVNDVIEDLEKNMKIQKNFLKNYLQISIVEKEVNENPILEITPYLDTKELFFKVFSYNENLLQQKLQGDNSFLKKEAFGDSNKSFPSLPEIALKDIWSDEIKNRFKNDDELSLYQNEKVKKVLKPYHKYIAIVHADGDNMGEVVKSLKRDDDFSEFSKALFDYCIASHEKIKNFGGETIFAGGDDLLFFAPVVNNDKTIFNLLEDISTEFDTLFEEKNKKIANTGKQATLSFGVSITYYKYPLYEALKNSRALLVKAKVGKKNNIAFTVTKHSGQIFGGTIPKSSKKIYQKFIDLTSSIDSSKDTDNFLHSLHHKLDTFKEIVNRIGMDEKKLKNFFENYFNKQVHKKYEVFFISLVEYMNMVYQNNNIQDKLRLIYASLRFVKFIKGDKS